MRLGTHWKPRNSPCILHLFFADDLLHFGEASGTEARIMEHILSQFCQESGQKINTSKSKLFASENIPCLLAWSLSMEFNIPLTNDLGKYLNMPILHGRIGTMTYYFLVVKVKQKLSGWKRHSLSKAAWLLLLNTSLSATTAYVIQSTSLPRYTIQELEHVRGEDHHSHIFHSIAWDTLCRSKEFGGLSIPNLQKLNLAYLAKLDWCFSQHQHALWGQVFHGKYGNVQDACV